MAMISGETFITLKANYTIQNFRTLLESLSKRGLLTSFAQASDYEINSRLYEISSDRIIWLFASLPVEVIKIQQKSTHLKSLASNFADIDLERHQALWTEYLETCRDYGIAQAEAIRSVWLEAYEYPTGTITIDFVDSDGRLDYLSDQDHVLYKIIVFIVTETGGEIIYQDSEALFPQMIDRGTTNEYHNSSSKQKEKNGSRKKTLGIQPKEQKETKPWEQVPERGWDRRALELWWTGYTIPEISRRMGSIANEKTIRNRFSVLRKLFTRKIVPTKEDLRKMNRR